MTLWELQVQMCHKRGNEQVPCMNVWLKNSQAVPSLKNLHPLFLSDRLICYSRLRVVMPLNNIQITPRHVAGNRYLHFINSHHSKWLVRAYILFCLYLSFPTHEKIKHQRETLLKVLTFKGFVNWGLWAKCGPAACFWILCKLRMVFALASSFFFKSKEESHYVSDKNGRNSNFRN